MRHAPSSFDRQRQIILKALGVLSLGAPLACGANVVFGEPEGQGGDGGTSSDDDGPPPNGGAPSQSSSNAGGFGQGGNVTSFGGFGQGGASTELVVACFPALPDGCPEVAAAMAAYGNCTWTDGLTITEYVDGPIVDRKGQCCYEVAVLDEFCGKVGRPLVVEGETTQARLEAVGRASASRGWSASDDLRHLTLAPNPVLSEELAKEVAQGFLEDALLEHASIAAFGRVALELLAHGAPAELVADTHRAALDEIRHASTCFELARRFGAQHMAPGPIANLGALTLAADLITLARAAFLEGCVAETIAAAVAREQAARAADPEVRRALAAIAEDEERHAALAFRTVAWAIERGGAGVREAIGLAAREVLRPLEDQVDRRVHPDTVAPGESYGRLHPSTVQWVAERAVREVVRPCTLALLAAPPLAS